MFDWLLNIDSHLISVYLHSMSVLCAFAKEYWARPRTCLAQYSMVCFGRAFSSIFPRTGSFSLLYYLEEDGPLANRYLIISPKPNLRPHLEWLHDLYLSTSLRLCKYETNQSDILRERSNPFQQGHRFLPHSLFNVHLNVAFSLSNVVRDERGRDKRKRAKAKNHKPKGRR